jgi:hypothetical protein
MWQFLTDSWEYSHFGFLRPGIIGVLLLGCLFYDFKQSQLGFGYLLLLFVVSISLGALIVLLPIISAYDNWNTVWEGHIVRKYTLMSSYKSATRIDYLVELRYSSETITKMIPAPQWDSVAPGDYLVKKSRSYMIEGQSQNRNAQFKRSD